MQMKMHMKIYRNIITAVTAALAFHAACAQTTQRLTATKANDYALVYTLPRTALEITLEGEITLKEPGEFYKYAKKYLNADSPVTAESRTATLKSAAITPAGVPDPEQRYAVQFKGGTAPFIYLTPEGLPLAFNTDRIPAADAPQLPVARAAAPTPLETPAARQVISEEMLQSQSAAKRAELAARAIFDIRATRSDLISGQADNMPPDGKSLQLMLDNLQAQEEALEAMFMGTTKTWTVVTTVTVTPDDDIDHEVIARLSALDGFVGTDNLSGAPVYLDLTVTERGELPVNDKGEPLPFPKNGFPYCIPGSTAVKVSFDGRAIASSEQPMAQFGMVYGLAANSLTDKKAPRFVIFDPATGAFLESGPVVEE